MARKSGHYECANAASLHWKYKMGSIYLQLRNFSEDKSQDHGWYFNSSACLEVAHLFARLAKELKKDKKPKPKPAKSKVK